MVRVELSRIVIDERRQDQMIVLKEVGGERKFPIVIGILEASSIKMKVTDVQMPRPLTHDLLLATIEGLGARVERVLIDDLVEGTFYAKIILKTQEEKERSIDARPSDSIALAVRAGAPIFVADDVLARTSISNIE